MSGLLAIVPADPISHTLAKGLAYRGTGTPTAWTTDLVSFGYCPSPLTAPTPDPALIMSGWIESHQTSESLLKQAYEKWGLEMCPHLVGEFSFILWDSEKQLLLAATDHFGTQPLFWCRTPEGKTLLSNCINTLRKHPQISDHWNERAVLDFLLFTHNTNAHTTEIEQIQRLPPAHALVWRDGDIQTFRYWSLPDPSYKKRGAEQTVAQFREVFQRVMQPRLKAGRLSFDLSGGIDTTTNLVTATELVDPKRIQALTLTFREAAEEYEAPLAGKTAEELQVAHKEIVLDDAAYSIEGEWMNPLLLSCSGSPETKKYREASHFGPVLVSGDGGDPLFVSSGWRDNRCGLLIYVLALYQHLRVWGVQPAGLGWKKRLLPDRPRTSVPAPWIKLNSVPQRGKEGFWPDMFLRQDSAAHGGCLHVTYPFFDRRLWEFLSTVPPVPWFRKKALARLALRGRAPEEIVCRPKTNAPPYHQYFQQWLNFLQLDTLIERADSRCFEFVEPNELRKWIPKVGGLTLRQQRQLLATLHLFRWSAQKLPD